MLAIGCVGLGAYFLPGPFIRVGWPTFERINSCGANLLQLQLLLLEPSLSLPQLIFLIQFHLERLLMLPPFLGFFLRINSFSWKPDYLPAEVLSHGWAVFRHRGVCQGAGPRNGAGSPAGAVHYAGGIPARD